MSTPLTARALALCSECLSCVSGKNCKFIQYGRGFSFKYVSANTKAARLLVRIKGSYGETVADLIQNFKEHPELTANDIAEMAGISRERVRQWLMKIHGTTKKKKLYLAQNDCRIKKVDININRSVKKRLADYYENVFEAIKENTGKEVLPVHNSRAFFQTYLVDDKTICIRRAKKHPQGGPDNIMIRDVTNSQFKIQFMIFRLNTDFYIIPQDAPFKWNTFVSKSRLEPYKNAWNLLD